MRELKRSIAKARMRERGLTKINRQRFSKTAGALGSFFSRNWREFAAMEPLKPKRRRRSTYGV
jgi:hypothetical protein